MDYSSAGPRTLAHGDAGWHLMWFKKLIIHKLVLRTACLKSMLFILGLYSARAESFN